MPENKDITYGSIDHEYPSDKIPDITPVDPPYPYQPIPTLPENPIPNILEGLTMPEKDGGGLRYDIGKNRLDLIPGEWTWALADVLSMGAVKYAERNWERGMQWSKVLGCILRHITKFLMGERYDDETGCHHLAMAAWNCLALMSYDIRGIQGIQNLPDAPEAMDPEPDGIKVLKRVNSGSPSNPAVREALGLDQL